MRWLLGLTFVGMFFAQSYVQIMPVFADLLGTDEQGYGYLLSAGGLGSVLGTVIMGAVAQHQRLGAIMLGGAALSVVLLIAFALATELSSLTLALVLVFLTATCASVFMVISMTVMQLVVPDALRGRVMGIHTIGYSLVPLGGLFLGALAAGAGAPNAVIIGALIYLAAILITTLSQKPIRRLDGNGLESTAGEQTYKPPVSSAAG